MEIIQIVGYKNSGKTTTVAALLQHFSKAGVRVASLKHHGHGGIPEGFDSKDSKIHHDAGAVLAGVAGEGLLQFVQDAHWELEQVMQIYKTLQVDLLFVEGYKKANHPKVVLVNEEADKALLTELSNIIAIVSNQFLEKENLKSPIFKQDELVDLCNWIWNHHWKKKE